MKIFFATDIHGSEVCWRKFLNSAAFYKADMVILGGDVTGKVMVPIVDQGGRWKVTVRGQEYTLETAEELDNIKKQIRNAGSYPAVVSPDELKHLSQEEGAVDRRFTVEMTESLDRWLDMADGKLRGGEIPCILNGGNDDIWEIDDIIEQAPTVSFAENKILDIGGFYLASLRGIGTGAILSFAHTMGEFGVVLMVGGNIAGVTRTVSISIYDQVQALDYAAATQTSLFLLGLSFAVLAITYAFQRRVWNVWPMS